MSPRLIYVKLVTSKEHVRIHSDHPNLVSCQFVIKQNIPRSFLKNKSELCPSTADYFEDGYLHRLSRHADGLPTLTLLAFEPSYYCTQNFDTWWIAYYSEEFMDVATIRQHIVGAFSSLQQKSKKVDLNTSRRFKLSRSTLRMYMIQMTVVERFVRKRSL